MNDQTIDIITQSMYSTKLSSLLAEENIKVEFSTYAKTASFSPENRTIRFPYTSEMLDRDVHELFILHEVSHALHLPINALDMVKASNAKHSYFNIVLDIRDERLIKEKYPGGIKYFHAGYQKLLDRGFFGDVNVLPGRRFADRLNVYAKIGIKNGSFIPMSSDEYAFYQKCMQVNTIEELIDCAIELEVMDKDSHNQELLEQIIHDFLVGESDSDSDSESDDPSNISIDIDIDMDCSESDDECDGNEQDTDADTDEDVEKSNIKDMIDSKIREITEQNVQDIFDQKYEESNLNSVNVLAFESLSFNPGFLVDHRQYTDSIKPLNISTESVSEYRQSMKQSIDSMVRIFEAKKAASRYKNARISDTGELNMNAIHRYKFDEKVFKKKLNIPNGKNHGYYILLDLSGSMINIAKDVFQQLILLVDFFRRIKVSYKVIGFGQSLRFSKSKTQDQTRVIMNPNSLFRVSAVSDDNELFEILSSEQTNTEHSLAVAGLYDMINYSFGNTPTHTAIWQIEEHMVRYFKENNIEKKYLIVMTDGVPTDYHILNVGPRYHVKQPSLIITDNVSKKHIHIHNYSGVNIPYAIVNSIGQIYKNRYDINMLTISITKTVNDGCVYKFTGTSVKPEHVNQFKDEGYVKVENSSYGCPVIFAKPLSVETDIDNFDMPSGSTKVTSTTISKKVLSHMRGMRRSRSFLNALTETLAE